MKKAIFALIISLVLIASAGQAADPKETSYERVMRTKTLRCGYILLPPEMIKDLNTGKFSGLSYDIMEEVGKRLGLKIDWTEEVSFQNMRTGLDAGRYDAVCFSLYRYSVAAPVMDYSVPLFYSSTGVYVRSDDKRFDGDLSKINDPSVTIPVVDSEMAQYIAAEEFPKAKTLSMPQLTDLTQMMLAVETKKDDVAFVNSLVAQGYLKANPGKLRNIASKEPLRVFSHGFTFAKGQYDLVKMIDVTLEEMHDHGYIRKLLKKYDQGGADMPAARTYEMHQ